MLRIDFYFIINKSLFWSFYKSFITSRLSIIAVAETLRWWDQFCKKFLTFFCINCKAICVNSWGLNLHIVNQTCWQTNMCHKRFSSDRKSVKITNYPINQKYTLEHIKRLLYSLHTIVKSRIIITAKLLSVVTLKYNIKLMFPILQETQ